MKTQNEFRIYKFENGKRIYLASGSQFTWAKTENHKGGTWRTYKSAMKCKAELEFRGEVNLYIEESVKGEKVSRPRKVKTFISRNANLGRSTINPVVEEMVIEIISRNANIGRSTYTTLTKEMIMELRGIEITKPVRLRDAKGHFIKKVA